VGINAVTLPSVAPDMQDGVLVDWLVNTGETIERGEPLMEVESTKAVVEVEANVTGVLRRRLAEPGSRLAVGTLIGVIASGDHSEEEIEAFIQDYAK
jgi:pyruvate/2-oxoglutarate dehydrogenase complex dihydrolipoamide acyltransferase (E2) component